MARGWICWSYWLQTVTWQCINMYHLPSGAYYLNKMITWHTNALYSKLSTFDLQSRNLTSFSAISSTVHSPWTTLSLVRTLTVPEMEEVVCEEWVCVWEECISGDRGNDAKMYCRFIWPRSLWIRLKTPRILLLKSKIKPVFVQFYQTWYFLWHDDKSDWK